jgi:hypothetical protein
MEPKNLFASVDFRFHKQFNHQFLLLVSISYFSKITERYNLKLCLFIEVYF